MDHDTIVGIASGMGGGIGVIRISGPEALLLAGKVFRKKQYVIDQKKNWAVDYFQKQESHRIFYGYIVDGDQVLDEVMVLLMKAPHSYTKEDVVEIDTHGGVFLLKKILHLLIKIGARLAEPGEFTKRAFFNGRIDLSQAEAVMKMISSENDYSLQSAIDQLEGSVSKYIDGLREQLLREISFIEAALDDPEHISLDGFPEKLMQKVEQWISQLNQLLIRFDDGRILSEGINTVIVGRPNAGKSSLMNLLLDQERAIVTEIAGTTRDILEERVKLGNLILNLVDTAGIRETENQIESIGVEKAKSFLQRADFVIYVIDAGEPLQAEDLEIIRLLSDKTGVILFNKSDQKMVLQEEDITSKLNWKVIIFSNQTKEGFEELKDYLTETFYQGKISFNDQVQLTSLRQKEAVEDAEESLKHVLQAIEDQMPEDFFTIDMMDAYRSLGLIGGDTASEDLVNKIFSEFCVGK